MQCSGHISKLGNFLRIFTVELITQKLCFRELEEQSHEQQYWRNTRKPLVTCRPYLSFHHAVYVVLQTLLVPSVVHVHVISSQFLTDTAFTVGLNGRSEQGTTENIVLIYEIRRLTWQSEFPKLKHNDAISQLLRKSLHRNKRNIWFPIFGVHGYSMQCLIFLSQKKPIF